MKTLAVLPISTKNMLEESRVLSFIQRWAQTKTLPHPVEIDGYSSENTSRAQTPLNTPDGSSTKLGSELDGDTSKPAVYRRLKIISENSLDSALSDASKASDGKDEEEEDDDEEEDASSHSGLLDSKRLKAEPVCESAEPTKETMEEPVKEEDPIKGENEEEPGMSVISPQHQTEEVQEQIELDLEEEIEMKTDASEGHLGELEAPKEPGEEQERREEQASQPATEKDKLEGDQPAVEVLEPESQSIRTDEADLPPERPLENMESQAETQEAEKSPGSEAQPGESTTDAAPSSETPEAGVPAEVIATPVDPSVIGTPSQDEEEGVSDVESERSQETQLGALDISGMAARLLDSWKDLKVSTNRFLFKGRYCETCITI